MKEHVSRAGPCFTVGLRAVVDPLCVGATADELVEAARALPVRIPDIIIRDGDGDGDGDCDGDGDGDGDGSAPPPLPHSLPSTTRATPVALHHDCVARKPNRVPSEDLSRRLGEIVSGWGGGFTNGMYARFNRNATDPESVAGLRDTLRFVVIETAAGYILGLVTFAPQPLSPECDWSRKPNNFCAGTPVEIAALAVNVLVGAGAGAGAGAGVMESVGSGPATFKSKPRAVIVDPCCGGGTVLYAAWCRGYDAIGGDINPQNVQKSQENIASFRAAVPLAHAALVAIEPHRRDGNGSGSAPTSLGREVDAAGLLSSPPTVLEADALKVTDWGSRAAAALTGADTDMDVEVDVEVAGIVSSLPFGRAVSMGGKAGDGAGGGALAQEYVPLLAALLPQA